MSNVQYSMAPLSLLWRCSLGLLAVVACCLALASPVLAQEVPQGYQSDQALQKGLIVRLKEGDGSMVEPLTRAKEALMLGVVVSGSEAPVSLSNNADARQIFVATAGKYAVLVSDQNGPIAVGDYIAMSSLSGIGMKAQTDQTVVLGKALSAFDGKSGTEGTASLNGSLGTKRTVHLGRIAVDLGVGHNPLFESPAPSGVPKVLSKAAQIVTDQPVGAVRIYASLAILGVTIIIAGSILYAGVRSSITAIGRNPLAKHSIVRSLLTIVLVALIIFMIGLIGVYLILRL